MKIITELSLVGLCVAAFLSSCGGGSTNTLQNDPVSGTGDLCDNSYYTQLRGQYTGSIQVASSMRQCDWEISIAVTPASRVLGCVLNATVETSVTQLTVFEANDPNAYQCMDTNATYRLNEPNDNLSPVTLYDDVVFPVDVQVEGDPFASDSGPYFGDTSVEVPYSRLFDAGTLVNILTFNGDSTISVRGGNPPFFTLEGRLTKD